MKNNKKDNQENKVSIKLERHRWPDEIKKARRLRRRNLIIVAVLFLSFFAGWQVNNLVNRGTIVNESKEISRFERVYYDLLESWYFIDELDNPNVDLVDHAIKGMLEKNDDPHTAYMTEAETQSLLQSINMDFEGIGVQYYAGDLNIITRVFKNSPAEKAGVQAGDILYRIEDELVEGMTSDDIQERILGESGSTVHLEFLRNNEVLKFTMKRDKIQALVWGEMLDDTTAYLEISSFGNGLGEATKLYLDSMLEEGARYLIIDLRDNGGGYLQAIDEISRIFFDNNDVIYQEDHRAKNKKVFNVSRSEKSNYPFENIVLLMNENSASASEVFALAMQENLGSKIVGTTSFGKGTIQIQKQYPDSSALKITVGKWLSPSGKNIDKEGIPADYEVYLADIFYEDFVTLDNEIVEFDNVDPAVAYAQKALDYLGYHQGRLDGYYDLATRDALFAYQEDYNFEKEDSIDQDLLLQLYSSVVADWSQNKEAKDKQLHKAIEVVKE